MGRGPRMDGLNQAATERFAAYIVRMTGFEAVLNQ
jgi:hypothetical protein